MKQKQGSGWRLAEDLSRGHFPYLLGGDMWAIEITHSEWVVLVPLILKVVDEYEKLKSQLLPEETICLEFSSGSWFICIDGDAIEWSLQLILQNSSESRSFEAFWPVITAHDFFNAMKIMWESTSS
tara:strand:+ start:2225 stop:2602 length:378 start_codon:yes stop_codon:yes gene_type:complete